MNTLMPEGEGTASSVDGGLSRPWDKGLSAEWCWRPAIYLHQRKR